MAQAVGMHSSLKPINNTGASITWVAQHMRKSETFA